jgi:uncharacterized protein
VNGAAARIPGPDALRGFALFGICVVNLPLIARSWESYYQPITDPVARAGLFINSLLFEAKFFGLFSFLFGLGIYLILQHSSVAVMLRRLCGLFVFGLIHACLFYPGDILVSYALLGCLFLLVRGAKTRTLLILTGLGFALSALTYTALGFLGQNPPPLPKVDYLSSFNAVVESNIKIFPLALEYVLLFNWPTAFAAFCLGYLAGRSGYLSRIRITWATAVFFLIGVLGSLPYAMAVAYQKKDMMPQAMLLMAVTAPILSLAYAQLIFSLARSGNRVADLLAAPGRMSLTSYVAQSVIAGLIFHGYGLGYYNYLSYGGLLWVSAGIFVSNILFSTLWLRIFESGPAEWLLKSFSRWRWQQLKS